MIEVDISHIWGQLSLPNLLAMEKEVAAAHENLMERTGAGSNHLGWLDLPLREANGEIVRILAAAEKIRLSSDICVVVSIGAGSLGARAAIELLQGQNRNLGKGKGNPQVFFAGNNLSTRSFQELSSLLEGKDVSLIVISKSGTTLETAVAFRGLRWILERRYGTEEASRRIYAVTDPLDSTLRQMAEQQGWECFSIPKNVGVRNSVLTAAGLLPMAVAGIDIMAVLNGAADAKDAYNLRSFENPLWLYAGVRNALYRKGKALELLSSFEPRFGLFGTWWQQLFAQSEGKDGKGIFPVHAEFSADLYCLGQLIQQGERNLFETMLRFDPPELPYTIGSDVNDLDGLNYLADKPLHHVQEQAYMAAVDAHSDSGVPVITMDCGKLDDRKVGELFFFFQLACGISAYILGVNPSDQPGMAVYKRNLFSLLGRPGQDAL